jgi:hypothetical protein
MHNNLMLTHLQHLTRVRWDPTHTLTRGNIGNAPSVGYVP